jgi:hypothetical protein
MHFLNSNSQRRIRRRKISDVITTTFDYCCELIIPWLKESERSQSRRDKKIRKLWKDWLPQLTLPKQKLIRYRTFLHGLLQVVFIEKFGINIIITHAGRQGSLHVHSPCLSSLVRFSQLPFFDIRE